MLHLAMLVAEYRRQSGSVNHGTECHLLESGMVAMREPGNEYWILRRHDPKEQIDSKWDVLTTNGRWGAAACLCFGGEWQFSSLAAALEWAGELRGDPALFMGGGI